MFSCVLAFVSNFLTALIAVEKRRKSWICISSGTDALLVVLFCCIFPFLSVQAFQNCLLNYEGFIRKKIPWSELCRCWKNQYNLGIRDSSCLGDSHPPQNFITFRKILRHISLLCEVWTVQMLSPSTAPQDARAENTQHLPSSHRGGFR